MLRKFLYAATALVVIGIIAIVVIHEGKSERSAERQETRAVQGTGASTTTVQMPASSSPISTVPFSERQSAAPVHPHYGVRTKTSGCVPNQALPDPACSSGAVLTTDTSVICVSGYTQTVRDVPLSEKQQVFGEYGIDWSLHSGYEVDHIISLELGGSNEISNLYPESYSIQYGARVKDIFENYLQREVCAGRLPITVAQQEIATDWLKYYLAWQGDAASSSTLSSSASVQNISSATSAASSTAIYYTSSYGTAKYFYPASCSAWKSLSPSYLMSFSSLDALFAKYPNRTLSPQC